MEIINSILYMLGEMAPYILLGFLIAGIMYAFIPQRTMARHLSGTGWRPVVKAALIGVPLPLCSCGVLPTAIGMRRAGASRAATTSFLIATPQTGVDSIMATYSLLGPAFAVLRPVAALVTAVFGGIAVGITEKEKSNSCDTTAQLTEELPRGFWRKSLAALRYGYIDLVASIGGWLVIGLVIAALITVYVPADFFTGLGSHPIVAMLAVLIVAIPMYVCATGSIPIAMSLMLKGLSPGTALVLLMAGPAANFASFTLISREMGRRAAVVYLASIVVCAVAFGLAIDYLMPASWFSLSSGAHDCCSGHSLDLFSAICAGILGALLIYSFIKKYIIKSKQITSTDMTKEYTIKGMNCVHCQASAQRAIAAVAGVENVTVDLASGIATVEGTPDDDAVRAAVRAAGFDVE